MSQQRLAGVAAVVALVVAAVAVVVVARRVSTVVEDPPPAPRAAAPVDAGDPLLATITRIDATTFTLPPTTVDAWLAEPTRIARGVTGARRVHEPDGFQLDDVRPGSAAAALGLQTGDVIRGINGAELNDLAAIAPLIAHSVDQVSVDLRRGGHTVILNYRIGH